MYKRQDHLRHNLKARAPSLCDASAARGAGTCKLGEALAALFEKYLFHVLTTSTADRRRIPLRNCRVAHHPYGQGANLCITDTVGSAAVAGTCEWRFVALPRHAEYRVACLCMGNGWRPWAGARGASSRAEQGPLHTACGSGLPGQPAAPALHCADALRLRRLGSPRGRRHTRPSAHMQAAGVPAPFAGQVP